MRNRLFLIVIVLLGIYCPGQSQEKLPRHPLLQYDSLKPALLQIRKLLPFNSADSSPRLSLKPLLTRGFSPLANAKNILVNPILSNLGGLKKELQQELEQLYRNPFQFRQISLLSIGQYSNMLFDSLGYSNFRNVSVSGDVLVAGIPLVTEYVYGSYDLLRSPTAGVFRTEFDKDNYLQSLKKKLEGQFNPEDFLGSIYASIDSLKQAAANSLRQELQSIANKYKGALENELASIGDVKDYIGRDLQSMQALLDRTSSLSNTDQQSLYQQMLDRRSLGQAIDEKLFHVLEAGMKRQKGVQELSSKLREHYIKWEKSGLMQTIRKTELLRKEKLLQIAKDPGILKKIASSKLKLTGLQRLFLSVEKMNAGQNVANSSPLSLSGFLNNGVNIDFLKSNNFISGIIGTQKTLNNIFDQPFTENVFNNSYRATGLSFGKGGNSGSHSHFSVNNFQQLDISNGLGFVPYLLPRNIAVTTFSKSITLGGASQVNVDISKSSTQFVSEINTDSSAVSKSSFGNLFSRENLLNNVALAIDFAGELKSIDFQHKIAVKVAADRYFNPGIQFVPGGTREILADLRKSFLNRKLRLRVRGNFRQYDLSAGTGNRFNHFSSLIDLRWKMKKGRYLAVRYTPTRGTRLKDGDSKGLNRLDRISAEFNFNQRFKGIYYRNYIVLAHQNTQYDFFGGSKTKNISWQVSSMQNITVGRQLLYWNIQYNYLEDPSKFIFFNTSLNSDIGLTYSLGKNITASSAINYNGVKGWYSQLGIRQNISGQVGKRLLLSMYLDAGRNLRIYQQLPYNNTIRADWSVQYLLSGK